MFTADMEYSDALRLLANAYATKTKEEADKIYDEYIKYSRSILQHELERKDMLTSYN